MSTIKVDCPACHGISEGPSDSYRMWICTNRAGRNFYTFTCSACKQPVAQRLPEMIEKTLAAYRVPRHMYQLDAEVDDPARTDPRPLTVDDQLDMILAFRQMGSTAA